MKWMLVPEEIRSGNAVWPEGSNGHFLYPSRRRSIYNPGFSGESAMRVCSALVRWTAVLLVVLFTILTTPAQQSTAESVRIDRKELRYPAPPKVAATMISGDRPQLQCRLG